MKILVVCFWNALTGYGRAARDYVAALAAAGHEVRVVDWTSINPTAPRAVSPEERYRALDDRVTTWAEVAAEGIYRGRPDEVAIFHGQPRLLAQMVHDGRIAPQTSGPRVAMTTWETSEFPAMWAPLLGDGYDRVLVPSTHCQEVLERHPAFDVQVVPHTFDPAFWAPDRHRPRLDGDTSVRFYAIGAWDERKNHGAILRAYLHAFTARDRVRLTIRAAGLNEQAVRSIIARSALPEQALPQLVLDARPMTECELVALHTDNDVFVSASRGEGWGLGLFEAAVSGKIVITPTDTGEAEYLFLPYDDATDERPCYAGLRALGPGHTPCFAGPGPLVIRDGQVVGERMSLVPGMTCHQTWGDPNVLELAGAMRRQVLHLQPGVHRDVGHDISGAPPEPTFGRETFERRFAYPVVADLLGDVLGDLL